MQRAKLVNFHHGNTFCHHCATILKYKMLLFFYLSIESISTLRAHSIVQNIVSDTRQTTARRQPDAMFWNQASDTRFQNHASDVISYDHASDVQYKSSYVVTNLFCSLYFALFPVLNWTFFACNMHCTIYSPSYWCHINILWELWLPSLPLSKKILIFSSIHQLNRNPASIERCRMILPMLVWGRVIYKVTHQLIPNACPNTIDAEIFNCYLVVNNLIASSLKSIWNHNNE